MRPRAALALASATLMALMSLAAGPVAHAADLGPYPSGGLFAPTQIPIDFGPQTVGTTATVSVDFIIADGRGFDGVSSWLDGVPDDTTAFSMFSIDSGTCDGAVGPTMCTVHVSFTPTSAQPFTVKSVVSECPSTPGGLCPGWLFQLSGTGVAAAYDVSPFSQPVDNLPTLNIAKAGSTVPLKFNVTDSTGAPVTDLTAADVEVTSTQGGDGCGTEGGTDSIETYVASSGLQNLGGGAYQFNWATPKSYKNQWRTMTLTASGGSRRAAFQFK